MNSLLICLLLVWIQFSWQAPDHPSIFNGQDWISIDPKSAKGPLAPISTSWADPLTTIFVGIVSYRDDRCSKTLHNVLTKAKYPERLRIGIVQQVHTEEDNFHCVNDYCQQFHDKPCPFKENIRLIETTHQLARGPNHARYLKQTLLNKQDEFCLNIDAHVDFVDQWDVELFSQWYNTHNEYAVLSSVLPDVSAMNNEDYLQSKTVPHLCAYELSQHGFLINQPPTQATYLSQPIISSGYSSSFHFAKCHFEHNVPIDPDFQMLYQADEVVTYARLWTKGYDVYTPTKPVVFHDYTHSMAPFRPSGRSISPMEWNIYRPFAQEILHQRYDTGREHLDVLFNTLSTDIHYEAKMLLSLSHYGLGISRSLHQWYQFIGYDSANKQFEDRCLGLPWIPYIVSHDPLVIPNDPFGGDSEKLIKGSSLIPLLPIEKDLVFYPLEAYYVTATEETPAISVKENTPNLPVLPIKKDKIDNNNIFFPTWLSSLIDEIILDIDQELGVGHGNKVMKVVVLSIPFLAMIIYFAIWMITSSGKQIQSFEADLKIV